MPEISEAVKIEHLAQARMQAFFPRLADCRIRWVFSSSPSRGGGCRGYAKIVVLSSVHRHLSRGMVDGRLGERQPDDVVIVLAADVWSSWQDETKAVRLDHLLSHLERDDATGNWMKVGHEVEEFTAVVKRHGIGRTDLRLLGPELKQLALAVPDAIDGEGQEVGDQADGEDEDGDEEEVAEGELVGARG